MRSTTTWKSCALGAAVAAALLATTACEPDEATGADTTDTKPSAQVSESSGGEAAGEDSAAVAACLEGDLSITSSHWDGPDAETVRHILITAKNVGDKECALHHHPYVQLGDAQRPAPVIEDSKDELVTVAPGAEGYAALLVSGGGMDEYEVTEMTLALQGPESGSQASESIGVELPEGVDSLFMDDGVRVTYWGGAEGLVTDFIKNR
ncbi:DUF4232 domain-containing protein [Streptomyces sp. S.PB5]|uniref:DUF4232 domain-containing protein n=1 Tax=Streptomyces sp. S.PB5 TaxID=3020844 RepID=UPI0025AF2B07|nr:DUF4232 domain-containing protein [Streptomyces sp. S.PB5]MDN3020739.1 DUF4232 domain-containing protein [Streptomyces sp. S.PB5]